MRLLALLLLLPSCSLIEQASADRVMAGSVVFVPTIPVDRWPQLAGQVRSQVKVYYAKRPAAGSTKMRPISGALLRLVYPLAPQGLPLREEPDIAADPAVPQEQKPTARPKPGVYVLDIAAAGVQLLPHAEYRVVAEDGDQEFQVQVTMPVVVSDADAIGLDPIDHAASEQLEVRHPAGDQLAFIVVRWAEDPDRPDCPPPAKIETYSTVPKSAKDANELSKDDARWSADPLVVPGTAFPTCGIYAVVVAPMSRGGAATTNLFLGSQLFAGKAQGQIYRVK